jgi:hypothetical protein
MTMTIGRTWARRPVALALALAFGGGALVASAPVMAVKFGGEGWKGSFDSTISFGLQRRMQDRDCRLIGNDNGGCVATSGVLGERVNGPGGGITSNPDFNFLQTDDGNLNYDKGDIVSAALKGTHELSLRFDSGWSSLIRGSWLHDFKADDTKRTSLSDSAEDLVITNATLLDAWISKEFQLFGHPAKAKLGNQVISWGEDIFIYGGVNVINALDLRRARTPGVQLKEIFKPAPMFSINTGLPGGFSMEAFYQFRWNSFTFDPVGTYFSTADVVGKGQLDAFIPSSLFGLPTGALGDLGTTITDPSAGLAPGRKATLAELSGAGSVVTRSDDKEPSKHGQFGMALRYKQENADTEWGFYYLRYHDKIPSLSFRVDPSITSNPLNLGYFLEYGEDRDLFGVSLNTKLGDWAVGAELSYRPKDSVFIDPTVPLAGPFAVLAGGSGRGYVEEKKWQAHLTGLYFIGPNSFGGFLNFIGASEGTILAEAVLTRYPNLDLSGRVPYLLTTYDLPDKTSYGYVFEMAVVYPDAFGSGVNLTPQLDFFHDVNGTSPNAIPFIEGRKALALALNFDYQSKWRGQLGYTFFWGGTDNNLLRDRDFLSASVSYSF